MHIVNEKKYMVDENKTDETVTTEGTQLEQPNVEVDEQASDAEVVAPNVAESPQTQKETNKLWMTLAILFGAACIAAVVYYVNMDSVTGGADAMVQDAGFVLATVDGEAIYQKDLDGRLTEASPELLAQGIDMTDPNVREGIESQILNDIISYKLLVSASAGLDIVVSDDEVDALMQGYVEQSGGEELLGAELGKIGLTRDSFRERIVEQLTLQEYISQNIGEVLISEEDINSFYEGAIAGQEGAPELEQVREQIVAQLTSDSQQQQVIAFVASLRAEADVVVN
jgi:hypothetical protein